MSSFSSQKDDCGGESLGRGRSIPRLRAQQRRFELCIPRNQTARPCSQFPFHTSVNDLYISQDRYIYFAAAKQADRSWESVNRSQLYECRNWDWGRAVSFLGLFFSYFQYSIFAVCAWELVHTQQRRNQLSTWFSTLIKACSRSLLLTFYIREGRQKGTETRR